MYFVILTCLTVHALGTSAVSFSSWRGEGCRGEDLVSDKGLYPNTCTFAGSDASSIIVQGLANKNNANTYIQLYADLNCKEYVTTVKHSKYCINSDFQSLVLVTPVGTRDVGDTELIAGNSTTGNIGELPFEELTSEEQATMDEQLETMLDEVERQFGENPNAPDGKDHQKRSRLGMSILPRADGDEHTSETDSAFTGIEVTDNNSPGDSAGFRFANNNQRNNWATTTYQRLMAARRNHPGDQEYNGAQNVNSHSLQFDITMDSGTISEIPVSYFRNWIVMFARQRDGHSHQVWNLYRAGVLYATLTLKAFRAN